MQQTDNTTEYGTELPSCSGNTSGPINFQTHLSVSHDDILLPTALVQIKH